MLDNSDVGSLCGEWELRYQAKGHKFYLHQKNEEANLELLKDYKLLQVRAIAPQSLEAVLQSIHDCLGSPDWATRKAAADTLSTLAMHSNNLIMDGAASTLAALEACRFDKVSFWTYFSSAQESQFLPFLPYYHLANTYFVFIAFLLLKSLGTSCVCPFWHVNNNPSFCPFCHIITHQTLIPLFIASLFWGHWVEPLVFVMDTHAAQI